MFSTSASAPFWKHYAFRVRDVITPSLTMRVRFVAQDQPPEGVVEAAMDDFAFYDAATLATGIDGRPATAPEMTVSAPSPNPVSRATAFTLSVPAPTRARVAVYDLAGREVAVLYDRRAPAGPIPLAWNGKDARGRPVSSGVYWIRAEAEGRSVERKVVWVR